MGRLYSSAICPAEVGETEGKSLPLMCFSCWGQTASKICGEGVLDIYNPRSLSLPEEDVPLN